MAPQVGLEPTTDRLTADSSTTELLWINKKRVIGIEPTTSAWKAEVLPLNYTRVIQGRLMGIEPTSVGTTIRCVNHFATIAKKKMAQDRIELPTQGFSILCSTD